LDPPHGEKKTTLPDSAPPSPGLADALEAAEAVGRDVLTVGVGARTADDVCAGFPEDFAAFVSE
jgi:hypothetical protein